MCNLSPETLSQCMLAHPVFTKLTQGNHFKSKYIRTQLRLPNDQDVKHDITLDSFTQVVDLWYSTNATLAKRRARLIGLCKPLLKTSFKFFHLAVFQHLLQTWYVQAGCLSLGKPDELNSKMKEVEISSPPTGEGEGENNTQDVIPPKNSIKTCHRLFDGYLPNLPKYVTEFLTRLFLAAPRFLERSLYMGHLNLHKGHPVNLAHGSEFLDEFKARNYPIGLKPQYSLEMISSKAHEDGSYSALLILFTPDTCVLWIGTVSEFPEFAHMKTSALRIIDAKISFSSLKQLVSELFGAFERRLHAHQRDIKFLMEQFFPGALKMIYFKKHTDLFVRLDTGIKCLARKIHSRLEVITFRFDFKQKGVSLPDSLSRVLSTVGVDVPTYIKKINFCKYTWRLINGFSRFPFHPGHFYCKICIKFSVDICRRLLMISAKDSIFFWNHSNSLLTICDGCLKKYGFCKGGFITVDPSPNEKKSVAVPRQDSLPAFFSLEILPYHLISRAVDMTESALELLYGSV